MWLSWRRFALFVILGFLICFQTPTVRAGLRRTGHGYPWRCLAPVLESGTKSGVTISQVVDLGSDQLSTEPKTPNGHGSPTRFLTPDRCRLCRKSRSPRSATDPRLCAALLLVVVTAANVQDREGAHQLLGG